MTNFKFINRQQIENLLSNADDIEETKRLIEKYKNLKSTRIPFYLTYSDFDEILRWKLRSQYGRAKIKRQCNSPEIIESITKTAFSLHHTDKDIETIFKLRLLKVLVGVETAVASSILALCYPDDFGVVDFRIWRQLFGEKKSSFSNSEYLRYVKEVRKFAREYGFSVQQIDQAIWQYDIENG